VMFDRLASNWKLFGLNVGPGIITFALLTEGALLFVAAQTGFVDGPRVLATMASDRWLPRRFANLSARLVTQDGVITIGLGAIALLIGTEAKVDVLVVLYAINVFVTFTLSQLGMTLHWWQERKNEKQWLRKMVINGVGTFFTATILIITLTLKFYEGGWVTVLITGGMIALCFAVRRHYERVSKAIEQLEADVLPKLYAAKRQEPAKRDPNAPTAAILVSGYNGLGLATLIQVHQLFPGEFRNVVFIGVGEVDAALLKGPEEVHELEKRMTDDLNEYCQFAADLGYHPELRAGLAPDVVVELRRLCLEVAHEFPHVVFFAGKLIFTDEIEGFIGRFLHNHTSVELQNWLQLYGYSLVILPIRVGAGSMAIPQTSQAA
jgi:Amino acid permease